MGGALKFSSENVFNIHHEKTRVASAKKNGCSIRRSFVPVIRKSMDEIREENHTHAVNSLDEFCRLVGCPKEELIDPNSRGQFYIALRFCCAYFMSENGCNDTQIGKVISKSRTSLLYGRKEVASMVETPSLFANRFYYKLILEKIL